MIASISSGSNEMGPPSNPRCAKDLAISCLPSLLLNRCKARRNSTFTQRHTLASGHPGNPCAYCAGNNDANNDMISLATYSNPAQLWLAAAAAQGGDAPDEQGDQPDVEARSLRVLIVEDEFFISLDTKRLLQNLGHVAVAVAVSADQAVNIAERERPDVVLMDIRLDRHPRRNRCR